MAAAGKRVYRPVLGRVLALSYVGFGVWWLIGVLASDDRGGLSWTVVAWLVAVGAAVYAVFWRPAVVVDPRGVVLVNVVRDVHVPWARLKDVETRYALTLVTAGRRYRSWAAGAPGRGSGLARTQVGGGHVGGSAGRPPEHGHLTGNDHLPGSGHLPGTGRSTGGADPDRSSRSLSSDSGAAALMVVQAWASWRERPGADVDRTHGLSPVGVRWVLPVVTGVPTLVLVAVIATVGG